MCAMNPRLLRPLATGFNPRQIAGLAAWWDSTDNATITTDTGVSAWADKSGNGYTLEQNVGGNQPTLSSINGKQAFDYNGSSQFLKNNDAGLSAVASGSSTPPTTVLMALSPDVAPQTSFALGWNSTTNDNANYHAIHPLSGSVWRTFYRDGVSSGVGVFVSSTATYSASAAYIKTTTTAASIVGRVNGSEVINTSNTRAAESISTNILGVGALVRATVANHFDGKIGDILIYNRVLTLAEIQRVELWLAGKFGVTLT